MCMIGDFVRMEDVPKEKAWKGWRLWRVRGGILRSSSQDTQWYGRTKRAHEAPTDYDPEGLDNPGIWSYSRQQRRDHRVRGQVLLWGPTAVHRQGRRALWCKIISLSDPKLAKKYGVEVCK